MVAGVETAAGNDLDDVFESRVNAAVAATGIQATNGQELAQRYERASTGLTHSGSSGLQRQGSTTDLFSIFSRKGSANFAVLSGNLFTSTRSNSSSGTGSASVSAYIQFNTSGGVSLSGISGSASNWLGGSAASSVATAGDYEIRFLYSVNSSTGVSVTNAASSWTRMNANRRITLNFSSSSVGSWSRSFTITVELRRRGFTSPVISNTISVQLSLTVSSAWNGRLSDLASSYSESGSGQNQALVEILFDSNGNIRLRGNYPFRDNVIGSWSGSQANSANTEVRFVVTSGSLSNNGASSFTQLSSVRAFSVSAFNGSQLAAVRVELREVGNSSTLITTNVSVSANHSGDGGGGPIIT